MTAPSTDRPPSDVADALRDTRIVIDGVNYVSVDADALTFAHTLYLESVVAEAGLEDPAQFMTRDASARVNAKQLLLALYRSGRTFDFLAGALVQEGDAWSEQSAKVTALRLAATTDAAAKKALQQIIAVLVLGFFTAGLSSLGISPSASADRTAPSEPGLSAAPTSSAGSEASSADSPTTTPIG